MVSFLEKLKAMKLTEFSFTDFEKKVSGSNEEGERISYLVFKLTDPIPEVQSSIGDWDPGSATKVHDIKYDVTEVQCSFDMLEKYEKEFVFDEDGDGNLTKTGRYAGDMLLDLSRQGNVWLTDTKLSANANSWKQNKQTKRVAAILEKYKPRS